jgi:hypothetical protein
MRSLLIGLAISGLLAGAAHAGHRLVPGTDQIVAPTPTYFPTPASPPLAAPGLQSGIAGNADGSNDFPRAHPDPGSLPPGWSPDAVGTHASTDVTVPTAPASWKGSGEDWVVHSRACAAMYNTYDPSTDKWTRVSGAKSACPSSLGLHS